MKKKNRFLANKTFVVFSILAVCIILTAVFAPVVTRGVDPLKGSLVDALLPPCKEHIFGTDKMGRDIFSRVIYGARASLKQRDKSRKIPSDALYSQALLSMSILSPHSRLS